MSYTLVVVDMQVKFSASSGERVLKNCSKELRKAIKAEAAIIFLEFSGYGKTLSQLSSLVEDYSSKKYVKKDKDDGSKHTIKTIKENKFPFNHVKVVGINTEYCVLATVEGLLSNLKDSKIDVITSACDSSFNHRRGVFKIKNLLKEQNV